MIPGTILYGTLPLYSTQLAPYFLPHLSSSLKERSTRRIVRKIT